MDVSKKTVSDISNEILANIEKIRRADKDEFDASDLNLPDFITEMLGFKSKGGD